MKKIFPVIIVLLLFLAAWPVLAVQNEADSQEGVGDGVGTTTTQQVRTSPSPTGNQVQNQNQVKTKNQGEDTQIRAKTEEKENFSQDEEATGQGRVKSESPRSQTAEMHMSIVALRVEELLKSGTISGGIGDQVRLIAQEQKQAQTQVQAELVNIEDRGGLLKSIIGPDFKALKNMQKQMDQNQLRIEQLAQLQNQIANREELTKVQEAILALIGQNTALQEKLNLEEHSGGLFGWLFKWLSR